MEKYLTGSDLMPSPSSPSMSITLIKILKFKDHFEEKEMLERKRYLFLFEDLNTIFY
jgi:hypothetical protein